MCSLMQNTVVSREKTVSHVWPRYTRYSKHNLYSKRIWMSLRLETYLHLYYSVDCTSLHTVPSIFHHVQKWWNSIFWKVRNRNASKSGVAGFWVAWKPNNCTCERNPDAGSGIDLKNTGSTGIRKEILSIMKIILYFLKFIIGKKVALLYISAPVLVCSISVQTFTFVCNLRALYHGECGLEE